MAGRVWKRAWLLHRPPNFNKATRPQRALSSVLRNLEYSSAREQRRQQCCLLRRFFHTQQPHELIPEYLKRPAQVNGVFMQETFKAIPTSYLDVCGEVEAKCLLYGSVLRFAWAGGLVRVLHAA